MPTHEELARFLRRFNRLPINVRLAFIAAALQLAEDLGDRGFDPTIVRPAVAAPEEDVLRLMVDDLTPPEHRSQVGAL